VAQSRIKRLEIAIRKLITRKLSYSGEQVFLEQEHVLEMNSIKRILLLRQDRLGDLLISLPFLERLRVTLPDTEIDILLGKNKSASMYVEPFVDGVVAYGPSLGRCIAAIRHIRKRKYDLVIDLLDTPSTTSSFLVRLSGSLISLGFEKGNSHVYSYLMPLPDVSQVHISQRLMKILPFLGGNGTQEDLKIKIDLSASDKKKVDLVLGGKSFSKRLGIVLSGSTDAKYIGVERHIELIEKLSAGENFGECDILLFGTAKHLTDLENIRDTCHELGYANVRYAPISSDFHFFVSMLSTCDVILTPDTSAVHAASAFNIPMVVYYTHSGKESAPMPWYPLGCEYRSIIAGPSLEQLNLDEVAGAVLDLLR